MRTLVILAVIFTAIAIANHKQTLVEAGTVLLAHQHHYQLYRDSLGRTWRFDTETGQQCYLPNTGDLRFGNESVCP